MAEEKSQTEEIIKFLKDNQNKSFYSNEIAENLYSTYTEKYSKKIVTGERYKSLSNEEKIKKQIQAEIVSKRKDLQEKGISCIKSANNKITFMFKTTEESSKSEFVAESKEKDMYDPFINCLKKDFDYTIFAKRIDETKTTKKKEGAFKWMHPDIVGIQRLGEDLSNDTLNISRIFPNGGTNKETIKLWSFEIKKKVTLSSLREIFFQTLSNSSWANFAYLVYEEIEEQAEDELKFLCNSYGVGAISFNMNDTESDVNFRIIQIAKENQNINWAFVDKLLDKEKGSNKDFQEFMILVKNFIQTGYLDNTKTWSEWKNS